MIATVVALASATSAVVIHSPLAGANGMPKFAHVLIASGTPSEQARLDAVLAKHDYGSIMAETAADVAAVARERRPDVMLLGGTLGDADPGTLITALRGDPETARIPVMLAVEKSSEALRARCVAAAVEDLVEGPLDDAVILVRLRPLARLATLQAETHRRLTTARDFGLTADPPQPQLEPRDDWRVLVVGPRGERRKAIAPALGGNMSLRFEADAYRAGTLIERSRYDAVIVLIDADADAEPSLYLSSRIRANPSLFDLPVLTVHGDGTAAQPIDAYRAGASIALTQPLDPGLLRTSLLLLAMREERRWSLRDGLDLTRTDATRDGGTKAYNADFLRAHLGRLIEAARRRDKHLTTALFSIRNRADVARRHGPAAAELLVNKVGDWIGGLVRAEDLTGRLGEGDFCTIFPDTGAAEAGIAVHRVGAVLHLSDFALTEEIMEPIRVLVDSGTASLEHGDNVDRLLARARANAP